MKTVAYIGIGANLGDARQAVKDAVVCLAQQVGITVTGKSSLYRSAPVESSGDDYINAVVCIETPFTADQLLRICHHIEDQFGRERPFHNAPRTLDLDLLLYGDHVLTSPELTVPHPRVGQRAFTLLPLHELAPDLVIPGIGAVAELLPGVADQRIEKTTMCQCMRAKQPAA
ncbi:2-amino-4-hydroxy-6-hydroxymethyldihydropteridine diphosphokinase [Ralstonia sp. R-29]|uniref:2-amino-4-hydroxy-6- hydroxymethyldihydropteridine diphosphokinase n=1 Tax=Ralstonia sp. R-29 TaxID=3404059 RepID=UPI003CF34CEB